MAPIEVIDLTLSSPERERNITPRFSLSLANGKESRLSPPGSTRAANHNEHRRRAKRKRGSTSNDCIALSAEPKDDENGPFFVDLTPSGHPSTSQAALPGANPQPEILLLPQHVTVLAGTSLVLEVQPLSDLEDDNFIKYIDYEDTKDVVRYFHQSSDETTSVVRNVCKNCGEEGSHKTSACRVLICLTCGARDEHSTRSCPISKICFTCGMKGHLNANCPNRRNSRAMLSEHECNRCSAPMHKTKECPTWWRLYEYFSGQDRDQLLATRRQKRDMKLGEGGEGYVADDEWCYNCGNIGHWGDDCNASKLALESQDHSAFSKANIMKGPFYDPSNNQPTATTSRVRDWGQVDKLSVMTEVGRKGRLKSKAFLEKQATETAHDDDDWFASGNRQRNRPNIPSHQQTSSKRISFDRRNDRYSSERRPGPSLLDRMQMQPTAQWDSMPNHPSIPRGPRLDRNNFEDRSRHTSRRHDDGPRYRGGYGK